MGHTHDHGRSTRRALAWALGLNSAFLVIEAGIGWWTGSLALLSDAAHMVSDVGALLLAFGASQLAQVAASPSRSYGWRRAETLGAFVNGIALIGVVAWIVFEAVERLILGAPDVAGWPVLVAGIVGLGINLGSAWGLFRADRNNLNVRGALVHMMGDALGSVGAIVAAVALMFGLVQADPIIAIVIAGIVLVATWSLLRDAGRVLLQFAPGSLRCDRVHAALLAVDGAAGVHDLHIWTLDGHTPILSAHLVCPVGGSPEALRQRAATMLQRDFAIGHSTLQVEVDPCPHPCTLWHDDHDHDHHEHQHHH